MKPEAVWELIDRSAGPDACWPWQGQRDRDGYGRFWLDGQPGRSATIASRFVLTAKLGRPLAGLACHTCDNPPCCNPDHLYEGTHQTNRQDSLARDRWHRVKSDTCVRKHPWNEANTYVDERGHRTCRACAALYRARPENRERVRRYNHDYKVAKKQKRLAVL